MRHDRTSNDFTWLTRFYGALRGSTRLNRTSRDFRRPDGASRDSKKSCGLRKTPWNFTWLGEVSENLVGLPNVRRLDGISENPRDVERCQKTFWDSRRLLGLQKDLMGLQVTWWGFHDFAAEVFAISACSFFKKVGLKNSKNQTTILRLISLSFLLTRDIMASISLYSNIFRLITTHSK